MELVFRFVYNRDASTFVEILKKVDKLLLYTIYKIRKTRPYLKNVELQDLYQTSILGLHAALLKVKESDSGSKIIYKITRYVANEIIKENKGTQTHKVVTPLEIVIDDKLIDDIPVYSNLELEFIRERFSKLIEEDIIGFEEFEMLIMHFVNDMTYKDIAKQLGYSNITVSKKIRDILIRLKYEFRKRGWDQDYNT